MGTKRLRFLTWIGIVLLALSSHGLCIHGYRGPTGFLKKAIPSVLWVSEEWIDVVQHTMQTYLPRNAEGKHIPRTTGIGSECFQDGSLFLPPSSQAPWRPLCIGGSISVAGQTGFVPRSGHQETPVMGEGCPQLCTYRCLQWHGGQFPLPLRLAASNGNAHSHEELKSPHLLKMSKHRGTALGIRILISEITVSVINPYIYLLIFYLRNPFYVHYFIRASLPLYLFIR